MNSPQNNLEQIENYFEGNMSPKDKSAFETELLSNSELSSDVENYKIAVDGIKAYALKKKLQGIHEEVIETSSTKNVFYYVSGIAASLVLMLAVGYTFFLNAPSESELYTSYFSPYPNLETTRGDKNSLSEALAEYTGGNYQNAITLLNNVAETEVNKNKIAFYLGVSNMMVDDYEKAITYFKPLLSVVKNKEQARWYLGLSYLKLSDKETALTYFSQINPHDYKYKEAQELIDKLD